MLKSISVSKEVGGLSFDVGGLCVLSSIIMIKIITISFFLAFLRIQQYMSTTD